MIKGRYVKAARAIEKITQKKLADEIGVGIVDLSRFEKEHFTQSSFMQIAPTAWPKLMSVFPYLEELAKFGNNNAN